MSNRTRSLALVVVLGLIMTSLVSPFLASLATAALGQRVFEANPVVGSGDPFYPVYGELTLAQSFQVNQTYLLSNVTLRVRNDGLSTNALLVSICPDDPTHHIPVMSTVLANTSQATPNGELGPVNWSFPFSPSPILYAGRTYWIVAQNSASKAPPDDGYEWHESGANTYAGGSAYALNSSSGLWTGMPYDLFFITYGQQYAANVTLAMTASKNQAQAGDPVIFTVFFNNTANQPAQSVWINDTLDPDFTNASLAFPTIAPSSGTFPNLTFSNVTNGPFSFTLTVWVKNATAPGTLLSNSATLAYANATGAVVQGASADVLLNGPLLSASITNSPSGTVHDGELVAFNVTLQNSGNEATNVWVNDTLPSGFTSDYNTADSLGGTANVSGALVRIHFTNMSASTVWSFEVVARAPATLVRGARYTDALTLNYTSTSGYLMPSLATNLSLLASEPLLGLAAVAFLVAQGGPGQVVPAEVNFTNLGNEPAEGIWVNLTLDPRLILFNSSITASADVTNITFALANASVGSTRIFLNLSVSPSSTDKTELQMSGTIDYSDVVGNRFPTVTMTPAQLTIVAPDITLSVTPKSAFIEAGTSIRYDVLAENTGTGTASDVWINFTLPTPFTYITDTSPVVPDVIGESFTWHWTNVAPGAHAFSIYLAARTIVTNGTIANLSLSMDAQNAAHLAQPTVSARARAVILAPVIALTIETDRASAAAGTTLQYTLRVQNNGGSDAHLVWVVDDVDTRLQVVSYSSMMSALGNQTLNWTIIDLEPGRSQTILLTTTVESGVAAGTLIPAVLQATYTNSQSTILGSARSTPVTITVAASLGALVWILAGGLIVAVAMVFFMYRKNKVEIEDVFLVYRDGVLISHLSRTIMREKDEDVLSGMLTAVQEFVREAFQYGEHRELHQLDFGEHRILIERGNSIYLAVVYMGKESASIRKKVRSVIDRIEKEFGPTLEKWDGDMERVVGARDLIRDMLLGSNGRKHS